MKEVDAEGDGSTEKATALDYREMVEETPLYTLRKMVLRQFLYVCFPLSIGRFLRLIQNPVQWVPAVLDVSLLTYGRDASLTAGEADITVRETRSTLQARAYVVSCAMEIVYVILRAKLALQAELEALPGRGT